MPPGVSCVQVPPSVELTETFRDLLPITGRSAIHRFRRKDGNPGGHTIHI